MQHAVADAAHLRKGDHIYKCLALSASLTVTPCLLANGYTANERRGWSIGWKNGRRRGAAIDKNGCNALQHHIVSDDFFRQTGAPFWETLLQALKAVFWLSAATPPAGALPQPPANPCLSWPPPRSCHVHAGVSPVPLAMHAAPALLPPWRPVPAVLLLVRPVGDVCPSKCGACTHTLTASSMRRRSSCCSARANSRRRDFSANCTARPSTSCRLASAASFAAAASATTCASSRLLLIFMFSCLFAVVENAPVVGLNDGGVDVSLILWQRRCTNLLNYLCVRTHTNGLLDNLCIVLPPLHGYNLGSSLRLLMMHHHLMMKPCAPIKHVIPSPWRPGALPAPACTRGPRLLARPAVPPWLHAGPRNWPGILAALPWRL